MKNILDFKLSLNEAALWRLGQAGYILRTAGLTIVIDPYLSDSAGRNTPDFSHQYPPPIEPGDLVAHSYIVTHDHLDHLDPETLMNYRHSDNTGFVAPGKTAQKKMSPGISGTRVVIFQAEENRKIPGVEITGVYALPTDKDVLDTAGYLIKFDNGRSFYHTSDTEFHPLVVAASPRKPDIMAVPINGKWGNAGRGNAAVFAAAVQPKFVLPNHYDLMKLNEDNPETFKWFCSHQGLKEAFFVPTRMQPFQWDEGQQDYSKQIFQNTKLLRWKLK